MHKNIAAVGIAAALVSPVALQAQETVGLTEVIVTAERRETALQDTPISILALTADALEEKGVDDLMDLQHVAPNLDIKGNRTGGNNSPVFSIRGIGGGGGATGERGVGLYIDGIYVPRTAGSIFKVFDIDRVEVLRGPQGTLFGRNSEGGAIRLFTKQPVNQFDAYVRGTIGNFDHTDISGMLNIPFNDKLAVRAQLAYLKEDGYVHRGTQDLGGSEDKLARLQIAYEINDDAKLTIGGFYSDSKSDGNPQDIVSFDLRPTNVQGNYSDYISDALVRAGQAPLAVLNDPRFVRDDFSLSDFCLIDDFDPDFDKACEVKNDNKYWQTDAKLDVRLSDTLQLSAVGGFAKLNHEGLSDLQLLGVQITPDNVESRTIYQEVQLNAQLFGGKVDAVTGLNYFNERSHSYGYTITRQSTSTYSAAGGAANGNNDAGLFTSGNQEITQHSKSWGWFNSATWHITDQLNLTGGGRLAWDKKDYEATRFVGSPTKSPTGGRNGPQSEFTPAPGTDSTTVTSDHSWRAVDWRGTLDYHFTKDVMAYGTVSKAYRAGLFSYTIAPLVPGPAQSGDFIKPVPPEKVINLEGGMRTTWFDDRLRINPTGFYMAWTDRQTTARVACAVSQTCPLGSNVIIRNSGDIDLYGLELEAQFAVTGNLTLDGALGTTKYKIHDVVANGGPNLFPPQASPTYNFGATYSLRGLPIGALVFNAGYSYTAAQQTYPESTDPALLSDGSYRLSSYNLVNARIQWTSSTGKNVVTLFGNNLLDKTYGTFASKFGGGYWDTFNPAVGQVPAGVGAPLRNMVGEIRGRPREWGITLQHNFD